MSLMTPAPPAEGAPLAELLDGASYARISKVRRDRNDPDGIETTAGVRRQHEQNRVLAERERIRIVGEYTDNDVTASGKKRRPEFERLLIDLDSGRIQALVVWHGDRLLRVRGDLIRLVRICTRRKIKILTVKAGEIDFNTATGRLMTDILTAIAQFELDHGGERQAAKHAQLASEGKPNGGRRPFGYESDRITIRPDEAELFKEAAKRFLAGEATHSIARDWQERGIQTTGRSLGNPGEATRWTHHLIAQMLRRARYAGLRETFPKDINGKTPRIGTIVGPAIWDEIIDEDTCMRLREKLGDPQRRSHAGESTSPQLLTGLLYCGRCGHRMWSDGKGRMACYGHPKPGCGRTTILTSRPEQEVAGAVLKRLSNPQVLEGILRRSDDAGLHHELAEVQERLEVLARRWAEAKISDAVWNAANDSLEAQRRDLTQRIASGRRDQGLADLPNPLAPAWDDLSVRRQAIRLIVAKIHVLPPGTEGGRLKTFWKN